MTQSLKVKHSTITLLDPSNKVLNIVASHGLSDNEQKLGSYQLGEGVTGQVAKTGKAMIIPKISENTLFLNKTKRRNQKKENSFICVPILLENISVGTISVDQPYHQNNNLTHTKEILTVIASIIAQKVKNLELIENEKNRLQLENSLLKTELSTQYKIHNMVGSSSKMKAVFEMVQQVAQSNATVLIRGESGTGKELIAHAIHHNSLRAAKPFIKINCSALPEALIETELFGHEKGAFTDASERRKGRFEMAEGGTLFLDEIGELSESLQIKLLRVLQEKEFERLGGNTPIKANVRIITATNRDLETAILDNSFRQDFYYRINVFSIHVPALRERKSDILLLADYFVEKYAKENHKIISRISTNAIDLLMVYHWPGNVRELENCIERAVILSNDGVIHGHLFPPSLQMANPHQTTIAPKTLDLPLDIAVSNYEKELIIETLKITKGNKSKAAKRLGTTIRIMGYKVLQLGINPSIYKAHRH